jgi:hypothetical protein
VGPGRRPISRLRASRRHRPRTARRGGYCEVGLVLMVRGLQPPGFVPARRSAPGVGQPGTTPSSHTWPPRGPDPTAPVDADRSSVFLAPGVRRRGRGQDGAQPPPELTGKTVLLTGAADGLGRALAAELAGRGAVLRYTPATRTAAWPRSRDRRGDGVGQLSWYRADRASLAEESGCRGRRPWSRPPGRGCREPWHGR